MPTDTERRLEQLENLLLFGGGVAAGTASGRQLAAAAARAVPRAGMRGLGTAARLGVTVAQRHPVGTAATLAYLGYIHRDDIRDVAETLGEGLEEVAQLIPGGGPTEIVKKRALSKANKAVKYGMDLLKAGTKASTGADKGKTPKGAFRMVTKAAGLANPKTKGNTKGKGKLKALARKIKKWWK